MLIERCVVCSALAHDVAVPTMSERWHACLSACPMQASVDAAGITARTSGNVRDPRSEWRPMNSLTLLLPKLG